MGGGDKGLVELRGRPLVEPRAGGVIPAGKHDNHQCEPEPGSLRCLRPPGHSRRQAGLPGAPGRHAELPAGGNNGVHGVGSLRLARCCRMTW